MTMSAVPVRINPPQRRKYVRAVGPRLRIVLFLIFGLTAFLSANSAYLVSVSLMEWAARLHHRDVAYENYFYQYMFLAHLALGLLLVMPFVIFGIAHIYNTFNRPNRRAVRVGYFLFVTCLALLGTGIALMRLEPFSIGSLRISLPPIKSPGARSIVYWAHVITPLFVVWLYALHRLAGPRIKWRVGLKWACATAGVVVLMVWFSTQDPRRWNVQGPKEGTQYFMPSLARTASGNFIPAKVLMNNEYCLQCHKDNYGSWFHSAHHFSSFNNKAYLFSVRETREVSLKRDGSVKASRWCAGCHDVVPFFSGAFDDPHYDLDKDPTGQAGITCTACHSITHVNSTVGNADYTIEEPVHYPFAFSENHFLQFVNRQLIKAKPEFHKATFLKPLHKSAEFCSTCHKVSIPGELNHYKEFLRGQNHYDPYLLSGVSGHNARAFYYPPKAKTNCNQCHMPTQAADDDFGAKYFDVEKPDVLMVHNHMFPAANTGLAAIRGDNDALAAEKAFLKDNIRAEVFGIRESASIDGMFSEVRPTIPALQPGKDYLLEVVIRTLKLGHLFTQGTVDSNEVWVDVATAGSGNKVIGRSGAMGPMNEVDPWSHFINVYMLDRDGNRIDRRNPQDIFTPLYNHQIPPGAGSVVHYKLHVPEDQSGPLAVDVKVQYRKFDTKYMQFVFGKDHVNDLPVVTMASDHVVFPISTENPATKPAVSVAAAPLPPGSTAFPEWQRWNDYGIGLLLEGSSGSEKGELIGAAGAFDHVEKLKRVDGPLNLARVFIKEGRLDDAIAAIQRASVNFDPPAPRWTIAWLAGLVDEQNGQLDDAIREFQSILEDDYPELHQRSFDFTKDYEVINELGRALFERSKLERGDDRKAERDHILQQARDRFEDTLKLDSENVTAHYNLELIYAQLGDATKTAEHHKLHERYRPDDNARDRAIGIARRNNPAADHAAQATVIYDLQRPGSFGLPAPEKTARAAN